MEEKVRWDHQDPLDHPAASEIEVPGEQTEDRVPLEETERRATLGIPENRDPKDLRVWYEYC